MIGAAVGIRQNRWIRAFRDAGATSPKAARPPADFYQEPDWIFQRLVKHGVFVETSPGSYYLDEAGAHGLARYRRWVSTALIALLLFIAVLTIFLER